MKLKERDSRPKHQFKLGDTADLVVSSTLWHVVVLEANAVDTNKPPRQLCKVILAGRESDLYTLVRGFIARKTLSSSVAVQGYEVSNTRMKYTGEVPPEWLASINSQDISNIRFEAILDD